VFDAKRLIGRRFADAQVGDDAKLWPFRLVPSARAGEDPANAGCVIEVQHKGETRRFAPEEISAMVRHDAGGDGRVHGPIARRAPPCFLLLCAPGLTRRMPIVLFV
jgi:hypothetical protein